MESASPFLTPWANFYILLGSAAGALTGLLFVVITIVMNTGRAGSRLGLSAFTTPTLIHFGSALFVAATLSAPWKILVCPAVMVGVAGIVGIVYIARIASLAAHFSEYRADAEDWTWYFILPFLAYVALVIGPIFLLRASGPAMFAIAGGALALAFIAIRNSWDIVTYITIRDAEERDAPG